MLISDQSAYQDINNFHGTDLNHSLIQRFRMKVRRESILLVSRPFSDKLALLAKIPSALILVLRGFFDYISQICFVFGPCYFPGLFRFSDLLKHKLLCLFGIRL